MEKNQETTYYRTVPVSEKPKQPDLYHTLIEHEELGIEGLPCHNNYIGDPNGGYWEIDGDSKVTHYLQPIPLPDAERLREALEQIANPELSDVWSRNELIRRMQHIAREALSAVGDGWVRVEDWNKDGNVIIAYKFGVGEAKRVDGKYYKPGTWIEFPEVTDVHPLPPQPIKQKP